MIQVKERRQLRARGARRHLAFVPKCLCERKLPCHATVSRGVTQPAGAAVTGFAPLPRGGAGPPRGHKRSACPIRRQPHGPGRALGHGTAHIRPKVFVHGQITMHRDNPMPRDASRRRASHQTTHPGILSRARPASARPARADAGRREVRSGRRHLGSVSKFFCVAKYPCVETVSSIMT